MRKIAYVFPGQGSQYIGMGEDFYNNFQESRNIFEQASSILDINMRELIFEPNDRINTTEFTQIAIVTVSIAQVRILEKMGLVPDVCAGLSLGEYSALISGGALSFEDGIDLVRKRAIYMDTALPEGTSKMAAIIGLDGEEVLKICNETDGIVRVANYNCPGQVVITGENKAVDEASIKLSEIGARRIVGLNVSGGFHSPLLKGAGEKLLELLKGVEIKDPTIPYVSNVSGEYIYHNSNIKELLSKQVYSSVRWQQSIENMISQGIDTFIEIGPGRTLSKLIKKIDSNVMVLNVDKVEDLKKLQEVIHA